MPIIPGLGLTFDTVASTYEKFRPGYVPELYETILQYINLDSNSTLLEIGIGAGQATTPLLDTGCKLTAVEPGPRFSELVREKFRNYPGFSVLTGKFEDVSLEADSFDLIFSASAFHWVPEEAGYTKVFSLLKNGGAFARFANHPFRCKNDPALSQKMDRIYADYYYPFHNRKPEIPQEYTEEEAKNRALLAEKYGFTDVRYSIFNRTRSFSAKEYRMLLGTYSDHIAIEETIRRKFFSKIEEAINNHGGTITIYDTIDLQLARK